MNDRVFSVESSISVGVGGSECMPGPQSRGVCARVGYDIPGTTWQDTPICLSESTQPGRRQEGPSKVIP